MSTSKRFLKAAGIAVGLSTLFTALLVSIPASRSGPFFLETLLPFVWSALVLSLISVVVGGSVYWGFARFFEMKALMRAVSAVLAVAICLGGLYLAIHWMIGPNPSRGSVVWGWIQFVIGGMVVVACAAVFGAGVGQRQSPDVEMR